MRAIYIHSSVQIPENITPLYLLLAASSTKKQQDCVTRLSRRVASRMCTVATRTTFNYIILLTNSRCEDSIRL
jgi:hypothetical protein